MLIPCYVRVVACAESTTICMSGTDTIRAAKVAVRMEASSVEDRSAFLWPGLAGWMACRACSASAAKRQKLNIFP